MSHHSVAYIPFAKTNSPAVELGYCVTADIPKQARFADRFVLKPELDLNRYTCRAVIDWIRIEIEINRPSQHQWLQSVIEPIIGHKSWIKPLNPTAGNTDTLFRITFQEPGLRKVKDALTSIGAQYGLATPPVCDGIEISIDFSPHHPSDIDRKRMFGLLVRHFYPSMDLPGPHGAQPRFAWGSGKGKTLHINASGKILEADKFTLTSDEFDVAAASDATFYVGQKDGPVMWRIMDKVIDQQNRATGTLKTLKDEEKRIRIEVSLQREELIKLGIKEVESVFCFNFASLRSRYFRFMLPTFNNGPVAPSTPLKSVFQEIEARRLHKFLMTGVIGLSSMDRTRSDFQKTNRPDLISHLRGKGISAPRKNRSGVGPSAAMLSFVDLDKRIEMALRKLTDRKRAI